MNRKSRIINDLTSLVVSLGKPLAYIIPLTFLYVYMHATQRRVNVCVLQLKDINSVEAPFSVVKL